MRKGVRVMKKIRYSSATSFREKYFENKYHYFFLSLLLLIVIVPYTESIDLPLLSFFFLAIMLTLLWVLKLGKRLFWFCLALAFIASPLNFLTDSRTLGEGGTAYLLSESVSLCAYILFLLITILVLLHRIFTEKVVTGDTIRGGISIYFLMGIFWSFAYGMVMLFDSSAISLRHGFGGTSDLLYYSFVTMTTLGYGDIEPVSGAARSLAILEAMFGQIFVTVFIARLVGLHIRDNMERVK
jgi:hypothetical protein